MSLYKLVIVESPSKARTIEKYLGSEYRVIASKGHIIDLPRKSLGVDTETFKCELDIIPGKEQTVKDIQKLAKDASIVYLASDNDREGENISFSCLSVIKKHVKKGTVIKRALFNSITKKEILEAIEKAGELDSEKNDAQQTRRIIDRLVGYKVSPILWSKLQSGLSAGRVQSVTLKLIVLREREIIDFIPEKWFEVLADLNKDKINFKSKYSSEKQIKTKEEADKIIEETKDKEFDVIKLDKKEKSTMPQPPFTTSKLQQESSTKLKIKSKETMQLAQKLYENGHITYMRTDSVRTENDALKSLRDSIKNEFGDKYLSPEPIIHKQKKSDSKVQDAHEAIRPTSIDNKPEKLKAALSSDELRLYALIYNKFLASQMSSSISETTNVLFKVGDHQFKSSGSIVAFDGYRKVMTNLETTSKGSTGHSESSDDMDLPKLEIGDKLKPVKGPYSVNKESIPPARYNESGLVKELEDKGIGRPSTYAAIITNITEKGYVTTGKDERFVPTEVGSRLCDFLEKHFPIQMDVAFTSKCEELLDDIEEGKIGYKKVLSDFLVGLEKEIAGTKGLANVEGSFGGKSFEKKFTKEKCPKCSKRMHLIKGKNGEFLSCEDYPSCKSSMAIPSKVKVDCPLCKGRLGIRKTKNGDDFVGCGNYPECKFVVWENSENFKETIEKMGLKLKPKKK